MRLFIAIDTPKEVKDELQKSAELLRESCDRGSFPRRENYHITLAFLGEQPGSRARDLIAAMDCCGTGFFAITIGGFGEFGNAGGAVVWRGIEDSGELRRLHRELAEQLRLRNFEVERREFKPHLTMARGVILKEGVRLADLSHRVEPVSFTATKMTLMRSELTSGGANYTHLYEKVFR